MYSNVVKLTCIYCHLIHLYDYIFYFNFILRYTKLICEIQSLLLVSLLYDIPVMFVFLDKHVLFTCIYILFDLHI